MVLAVFAASFLGTGAGRDHWLPADGNKFQTLTQGTESLHRARSGPLQAKEGRVPGVTSPEAIKSHFCVLVVG